MTCDKAKVLYYKESSKVALHLFNTIKIKEHKKE